MIVLDFIRQQMPAGWKHTPSGWISGNCPMCASRGHSPDKRKRGGIIFSEDKFSYNCFNCNFKTGWSPGKRINDRLATLLKQFGTDISDIQRINLGILKEQEASDIAGQYIPKEAVEKLKIDWELKELPKDSYPIGSYPMDQLTTAQITKLSTACTYLMKRGLDFYEDWYWSPHMHFASRVILPFRYQNQIVGYTARWCPDNRPDAMPKYYLQQPSNYVFNLDAQKDHDIIIVTEGQLDAIMTGGVALSGNTPSDTQCSIIEELEKEIILLPDFDSAGQATIDTAIKRGWNVAFPEWDDDIKDANDAVMRYGRLFTVTSILNSVETSSTKIKILAKTRCR